MEFRQLRALVEVVRQGGFSPAAKVVFATQSAVSKAVKQLEDELGVPLLNRIGHRVTLTSAGEAVFRRATKLLADRDDLLTELDEVRGLQRGLLRLGLPPVGSNTLFAPVFVRFRQRYPGIDVQLLEEHGSDALEARLRSGSVELAATLLPAPADFDWQLVRREPLVALLPALHPLARQGSVTLSALRDTPFVLFGDGFSLQRIVLDACHAAGFEPHIAARSTQISFMVQLVGAGLGVAFFPRMIALQRGSANVRAVRLIEPKLEWAMSLAWRRDAYLSAAARAWLAMVAEVHGPAR